MEEGGHKGAGVKWGDGLPNLHNLNEPKSIPLFPFLRKYETWPFHVKIQLARRLFQRRFCNDLELFIRRKEVRRSARLVGEFYQPIEGIT